MLRWDIRAIFPEGEHPKDVQVIHEELLSPDDLGGVNAADRINRRIT